MKNGSAAAIKLFPEFDDHLPFPWITDEDERDEAEYRLFLRTVLPELIRVAKADNWLLSQKLDAGYLPDILAVIQRADEGLQLLWAAAGPADRERLVQSLAGWWPRYMDLRAQTKRAADELIAKRAAQQ